ncbi:cytochrome o ubiquinol oxidase subunit III [Paenibacillus hunanensis]|uniref:Cytochrome bo(3) ubiquinol oxidase subunit 3 n=1 Tax=Paenibacillus hunanensis TaxID=539262 RepID=A0ABU1J1D8_9BACL|nr:cytochrome o ubiquinol oxidase subunit III [Paenibacillus hunanensis]MCL9662380.1 cytochrome o ubiquinol oxidase subunit III [Paenibacillus hunanensis]MDR6245286.1 cytochrome o ubiquinol oxidase subunit 3 [Paenibacillus hunanensis]WPP40804.1 cytochrome o ubiquinol oxidase subunit III [Paenibacillus hunanensis]GGJ26737.1 cytochrome bo(3) ubiquinol oxidase subunit 3 [Paenibacillus hunanensis]
MAQAVSQHGHDHAHGHDHGHHDPQELKMLGFWIFLITDVVLFGTLFATYVVLHNNTAGGPTAHEIFEMPGVIAETFILLTSSFTSGLAVLAMNAGKVKQLISWLVVTWILGASFIFLEVDEFIKMVHEGFNYGTSAFATSFFTLVGTHGLHVSMGLGWMLLIMIQLARKGITDVTRGKVNVISLYWHFLDAVWIFLLSVVYLMGVM